jgi:hypothetical protein
MFWYNASLCLSSDSTLLQRDTLSPTFLEVSSLKYQTLTKDTNCSATISTYFYVLYKFWYNASLCVPSDNTLLQRDTLWINTARFTFNLYMLPSLLRVNQHTDVSILVRGYGKSWEASKHTFVYYTVNRTWNNKTLLYTLEGLAARFVRSKPTPKILHIHRHQHTQCGEISCRVQARSLHRLSQHIPYMFKNVAYELQSWNVPSPLCV